MAGRAQSAHRLQNSLKLYWRLLKKNRKAFDKKTQNVGLAFTPVA